MEHECGVVHFEMPFDDEKGFPKTRDRINGGFFPKSASPSQHPSVVIHLSNIEESMKQVNNAGGKVLGEPVMIP